MTDALFDRVYDCCVVGSGASGSICAYELARQGLDVLVVEQGPHAVPAQLHPLDDGAMARSPNGEWTPHGVPWTACVVGGGTRIYAGVAFRLRETDFHATDRVADNTLDPTWPFGYETLRPYYDEIETLLPIARATGADPTAPPSMTALMPPHPYTRSAELLAAAGEQLGLHPFPTPLAINSISGPGGSSSCQAMGPCTARSCVVGAKADPYQRILAPLVSQTDVQLLSQTKAVALIQSDATRVAAIECIDLSHNRLVHIQARAFVLAANAIQTAALLLRSTSRRSPHGLGNSHDMVGRGLCLRACQYVSGTVTEPSAGANNGLYSTVSFTDHYIDNQAPRRAGGLVIEANPPGPTGDNDDDLLVRVEALVADQPQYGNRVRLSRQQDQYGLHRIGIDYQPHPDDLARLTFLTAQNLQLLRSAGVAEPTPEPIDFTFGRAHLHGTCRFSNDPTISVCDPSGRIHDLDNVYVVDGSLMPYPGAVNPTFTIQANALRVARGLGNSLR